MPEILLVWCKDPFERTPIDRKTDPLVQKGIGDLNVNRVYKGGFETADSTYVNIYEGQGCLDGGFYKSRFRIFKRR